jgi:hypothetical protein
MHASTGPLLALNTFDRLSRRERDGRGFGVATAAKPPIILPRTFLFLWVLQVKERADERTRTADLTSLRVISQALQGLAGVCKSPILKRVSLLYLALSCTVLRSRWCQSGVNVILVSA